MFNKIIYSNKLHLFCQKYSSYTTSAGVVAHEMIWEWRNSS